MNFTCGLNGTPSSGTAQTYTLPCKGYDKLNIQCSNTSRLIYLYNPSNQPIASNDKPSYTNIDISSYDYIKWSYNAASGSEVVTFVLN